MARVWAASVLACLSSAAPLVASAGDPETPAIGARVRVTEWAGASAGRTRVTGTLVACDAGSVTLDTGHRRLVTIPRSAAAALEVSGGTNRAKGALIGAAVGLTVGLLSVASGDSDVGCHESECLCGGGGCPELYLLAGVVAGSIGLGIGSALAPERWNPVPVERSSLVRSAPPMLSFSDRVSIGVGVDRGHRLRASVAYRF